MFDADSPPGPWGHLAVYLQIGLMGLSAEMLPRMPVPFFASHRDLHRFGAWSIAKIREIH